MKTRIAIRTDYGEAAAYSISQKPPDYDVITTDCHTDRRAIGGIVPRRGFNFPVIIPLYPIQ